MGALYASRAGMDRDTRHRDLFPPTLFRRRGRCVLDCASVWCIVTARWPVCTCHHREGWLALRGTNRLLADDSADPCRGAGADAGSLDMKAGRPSRPLRGVIAKLDAFGR